ncbi:MULTISPECIES: hypothetical protein [Rhizobium]|uniref:Uncharacterized protein n=1 Tax=Rhizobium wenxiniae TaxID=1737357 RepID=A0A7X0D302_9HYPH|nr:hypothetical protein [Rhizobium wenxiniae]MBB6166135.1 hypothetical protein [Rhizobium wenxiniae]GGG21903.1 hypothetical protein GCM10010924_59210 [Rhizobium wenxiniae]
MTNIKARGFDNAEQLREHLAELDDEAPAEEHVTQDDIALHEQIAALRREVGDLAELLSIRNQADLAQTTRAPDRPWLRIAATVAATFVLGRLVQKLRLGTPGAAAVPLIATQLSSRF